MSTVENARAVDGLYADLDRRLAAADVDLAARYPGDRGVRQPVHTVYLPADRYDAGSLPAWSAAALEALDAHAATPAELADAMGIEPGLAAEVHDRVRRKLAHEPVEDLRVDFEDGYGTRPDDEEDDHARTAATVLADAVLARSAPPYHGIRVKSLEAPTRHRAVRTLDLVVGGLAARGALTPGFVVTLPKVTSVAQVEAFVAVLEALERDHGLDAGELSFEIQVETPQAILGPDGTALVAPMVHAAAGRCTGLHYGTYDYSASLGVAAQHQSMEHPVADHAKAVMQVAAAGTGVFVSDGSTNVLPVGDRDAVHAAWRLHHGLVRRSLAQGIYQGWDLHPAQLPSRYAATYAFFREGLPEAAARLRAYLGDGRSGFLDEPATAVALAGFVLRGLECGAIDTAEVDELLGVDTARLARLARRRAANPLERFNTAPADALRPALLACCDVPRWADAVLAGRPYADVPAALAAADDAARAFTPDEVDRALAAHPRIGERASGDHAEAAWSRREQSGVATTADVRQELADGNRAYEQRFGRVFLICATGLGADQVLASLRARLANDPDTEAAVVADELRKIALLRLERALTEESPS